MRTVSNLTEKSEVFPKRKANYNDNVIQIKYYGYVTSQTRVAFDHVRMEGPQSHIIQ